MAEEDRKRRLQFEVYKDLLSHVEDGVTDSGSAELTLAKFEECDKTANFVVCPVIYIVCVSLDDFMETVQRFPLYERTLLQKDDDGRLTPYIYVAWNRVVEDHVHRPIPRHPPFATRHPRPPPMWHGVICAFSLLSVALFALVKQPLLGWA